eukprot:SAG31_NODE_19015_length_614_cov_1.469903_1_plen_169_part_10
MRTQLASAKSALNSEAAHAREQAARAQAAEIAAAAVDGRVATLESQLTTAEHDRVAAVAAANAIVGKTIENVDRAPESGEVVQLRELNDELVQELLHLHEKCKAAEAREGNDQSGGQVERLEALAQELMDELEEAHKRIEADGLEIDKLARVQQRLIMRASSASSGKEQ